MRPFRIQSSTVRVEICNLGASPRLLKRPSLAHSTEFGVFIASHNSEVNQRDFAGEERTGFSVPLFRLSCPLFAVRCPLFRGLSLSFRLGFPREIFEFFVWMRLLRS
jgi:hypothetical protein